MNITTFIEILAVLAEIHFNLFDVGYDKFKYGKNFGWNIGLGVKL